MHRGAVAAVDGGALVDGDLHGAQDLARQLAAADGVERQGRAGLGQGLGEVVQEGRRGGVHDMGRADVGEDVRLLAAAHDVHQGNAVLQADPVQHLAEVGGRGGVDQGGVALPAHGLHHAQRRQRIDEARRAVGGGGAGRQRQDVGGLQGAVLGVHRPADAGHELAEQRLGGRVGPRRDHRARAFVAHRHGLVDAPGHGPHELLRHGGRHHGAGRRLGGGHVGGAQQQAEVRGVDGRTLDAHQDLVGAGVGDVDLGEGKLELAAGLDQRA